jgi:predicted RNase H-like nuclease (RuvC/YqgF family)
MNKVIHVDRYAKYVDEIRKLKDRNADLERLNQSLAEQLDELHGEYLELRYAMKGMASQAEVLALRKKILELQNKLGLKYPPRHKH